MQIDEFEKPVVLKKAFFNMDYQILMLVLFPYIFFGWGRASHLPTVALYWTLGSIFFIFIISSFFKEHIILQKDGVSLFKSKKEINFIAWNDINRIEVEFAGFTQHDYIKIIRNDKSNLVINGYLNHLQKLTAIQKIKTNIDLSDDVFNLQSKYNLVAKVCFYSAFVMLILWNVFDYQLKFLHVSNLYIEPIVFAAILGLLLLCAGGLPYLIHKHKLLRNAFSSALAGVLFLSIFSTSFLSSAFKIYNESFISKQHKEKSITAKLLYNNKKSIRQDWKKPNTQASTWFVIENWQGINKSLSSDTIYEIPAYKGKFNYFVITKEQFERAKVVK